MFGCAFCTDVFVWSENIKISEREKSLWASRRKNIQLKHKPQKKKSLVISIILTQPGPGRPLKSQVSLLYSQLAEHSAGKRVLWLATMPRSTVLNSV
jgi:hypothetical protein